MILSWLWSALTGGGLQALASTYAKFKDSAVDSERIKADVAKVRLNNLLEAQKLATQVRLATAGFIESRVLTFFTAFPFVVHLNLVALDTYWGLPWRVNAFPAPFVDWEGTILLSFFGVGLAGKAVTTVGAVLMSRRGK